MPHGLLSVLIESLLELSLQPDFLAAKVRKHHLQLSRYDIYFWGAIVEACMQLLMASGKHEYVT